MCLPCAQCRKSCGEALLVRAVKEKSLIWTLPAPPPASDAGLGRLCVSPKLNESTSISPLCFESLLSPEIPSSFRK